ncbi:response regulator [Candidatus Woesearchaeota archaeon]|nr:response regulator [Candidatus Woesearchaeota archaeon]
MGGNGKRDVLVIEDQDLAIIGVEGALGDDFNLTIVKDGRKGLEEALKNNKNGIILDYSLPGMNGLDLLKEYNRLIPEKERLPVIFMTGYGGRYRHEAIELGAKDYIPKPFKFRRLYLAADQHFR